MRDFANNIQVKRVISPVSVTDDTPQVGQIIDRLGYDALTYVINTGVIADVDVTFTVLLEESDADDMTGASPVDDTDMITQSSPYVAPEVAAGFQFDDSNQVRKLGYIGNRRYTRLTITPSNNASGALFSALAVLGHPHIAPVVQATS